MKKICKKVFDKRYKGNYTNESSLRTEDKKYKKNIKKFLTKSF